MDTTASLSPAVALAVVLGPQAAHGAGQTTLLEAHGLRRRAPTRAPSARHMLPPVVARTRLLLRLVACQWRWAPLHRLLQLGNHCLRQPFKRHVSGQALRVWTL